MKGALLLIELAGHVGLLLWGTHMVGTGVQRGFGTALRRWLGRNLSSRWQALPDPPAPTDPGRPIHLDAAALDSATVALANAARETLRMADMVEAMLQDTLEVIRRDDRGRASTVAQWSRCIEQLGTAIRRYLADVGDEQTLLDCTAN